jgi:hypothetical protein
MQVDRLWTTAMKQRIVRYRTKERCGIDFEMRMTAPEVAAG